jgi:hypothetical protein
MPFPIGSQPRCSTPGGRAHHQRAGGAVLRHRSMTYQAIARDQVRMTPLTLGREAAMPTRTEDEGQDVQ